MTRADFARRAARLAAKHALAELVARSGAVRWPLEARRVLILSFHRVVENFPAEAARALPALLIGARTLRCLLEVVARRWELVSLSVAVREACRGARRGPRVAAVTFDDGYRDVYEVAFPLLSSLRVPGAVYLPTDFVSGAGLLLHDRLYALLCAFAERRLAPATLPARPARLLAEAVQAAGENGVAHDPGRAPSALRRAAHGCPEKRAPHPLTDRLCATLSRRDLAVLVDALEAKLGRVPAAGAPMTWAMARALAHCGWEVGAHTRSHVVLPRESEESMRSEIHSSRAEIEAHTGWPCRHFAYPNGAWSLAAVRAVREAGFESAVTTEDRPLRREGEDPHLLPRTGLWEQSCLGADGRFSETVTLCNLAGAFSWLRLARWQPGRVPEETEG